MTVAVDKGLKDLITGLSSVEYDSFVGVLNMMNSRATGISSLNEDLKEVRKRIDKINAEREGIRRHLEQVRRFTSVLESKMRDHDNTSMVLLRFALHTLECQLEAKIAQKRPYKLLQKKSEIKKAISESEYLQKFALMVREVLKDG